MTYAGATKKHGWSLGSLCSDLCRVLLHDLMDSHLSSGRISGRFFLDIQRERLSSFFMTTILIMRLDHNLLVPACLM
jgi:hypothetical protein